MLLYVVFMVFITKYKALYCCYHHIGSEVLLFAHGFSIAVSALVYVCSVNKIPQYPRLTLWGTEGWINGITIYLCLSPSYTQTNL